MSIQLIQINMQQTCQQEKETLKTNEITINSTIAVQRFVVRRQDKQCF